jgi:putative mycofactocin binding protein MftB
MSEEKRYTLASGTQVREEDFGLLFYTIQGPRLYFLTCGSLLESAFFEGKKTLSQYLEERRLSKDQSFSLERSLDRLREKGVLLEC